MMMTVTPKSKLICEEAWSAFEIKFDLRITSMGYLYHITYVMHVYSHLCPAHF